MATENEELKALFLRMRKFCSDRKIRVITAHQHPYPHGYRGPPPPDTNGIIIIDYLSLLGG